MRIRVRSEIGKLRAVIMQPPGKGIERCTPLNVQSLAWDAIPSPHKALEEHQAWVRAVRSSGADVFLFEDLLRDILGDPVARTELVASIVETERRFVAPRTLEALGEYLSELAPAPLVETLFFGMTADELNGRTGSVSLSDLANPMSPWVLFPMSNVLYTRDPAAVVGDGIVFCRMHNRDREKEPLCYSAIFRRHPLFADASAPVWYGEDPDDDDPIEGGNVHCYSPNCVVIGINERTRPEAIEKLAERTMARGEVTDVIALMFENPRLSERDNIGLSVHMDMFLNMIDRDAFLFFPYMERKLTVLHLTPGRGGRIRITREDSLFETLKRVLKLDAIRIIKVGGDESEAVAFAEQRAGSGGNTVNLEPGKVCIWDRNVATIRALERGGIRVVAVEADELTKGGGGPRCSTMPLLRDDLS
jgi:arginine deiminase